VTGDKWYDIEYVAIPVTRKRVLISLVVSQSTAGVAMLWVASERPMTTMYGFEILFLETFLGCESLYMVMHQASLRMIRLLVSMITRILSGGCFEAYVKNLR
jgi:hypothetical protein